MSKLFGWLKGSAEKERGAQEKNERSMGFVPEKEEEARRNAEIKIKQASQYLTSDPQKAIGMLNEVLMIFPNHFGAYVNRGIAYKSLGETEKAAEDYKKSIEINPSFYIAHVNLAALYKEQGKKDEALMLYEKVLAMIPPTREEDRNQVRMLMNKLQGVI